MPAADASTARAAPARKPREDEIDAHGLTHPGKAQEMMDLGIMKAEQVAGTRLEHTLTSSIGGSQTQPKVTRFDMTWGHVLLLCSDGLIRHVSDDRIRDVLRSMTSARQACETLLRDALDGGGSDNITVVAGRAMPREG